MTPEVSVVVAVPSGSTGVAATLQSILGQSLNHFECVVVTADALPRALTGDTRVRRVAADASTSLGALRNAGSDAAAAPYVYFVDPGDTLDRHALRNVLVAAEQFGADIVIGRRFVRAASGKAAPVANTGFSATTTLASLDEQPTLVLAQHVTGKLYATPLLRSIRAETEGLVSIDAYLGARRITLIPMATYYAAQRGASAATVTAALADHRSIDARLAGHADPLRRKQVHFVKFELQQLVADDAQLPAIADYLSTIDPAVFAEAGPVFRAQRYLIARGDRAGVASTVDYVTRNKTLSTDLYAEGGHIYWCDRWLDTPEGREALDVTDAGFGQLPLSQLHFESAVTAFEATGSQLRIEGRTRNQLGRIPASGFAIAVQFSATATKRRITVPAQTAEHHGDHVTWQMSVNMADKVRPRPLGERVWRVGVQVQVGKDTVVGPLAAQADQTTGQTVRLGARAQLIIGDALRPLVTRSGDLQFVMTPSRIGARLLSFLLGWLIRSVRVRRVLSAGRKAARRLVNAWRSDTTKGQVYRQVLVRLPLKRRQVVFESHLSRSYSDSPKYIYEELRRRDRSHDYVWTHSGDTAQYPSDVRLVRRGSWRYYLALARSKYWVDNQGFPHALPKPRRTTYLQTWHGTAHKLMGEDMPAFRRQSAEAQERHRQSVARWDYFSVRTEHDVRTLVSAFHVQGELLRYGYARNDLLVTCRRDVDRAKIRAELGLPADRTIVLYAPTFRDSNRTGTKTFTLRLDLDQLRAELPNVLLLVRAHYLERLDLPTSDDVARDVSQLPDITPLMAAADVLITDYSSVMFDFAVTGRPMVFYAFDYDDYANTERGVYFDLAERAPGPIVDTGDALIKALRDIDEWTPSYADRYRKFVADFCEYDHGEAARRTVDHVFFGRSS